MALLPLPNAELQQSVGLLPEPVVQASSVFVPPLLHRVVDEGGSEKPAILLVSAAAAVGKTMLSKELNRKTRNPRWDLGQFTLGSSFFVGQITEVFGAENYASVSHALSMGEICLVLDAADEALVRSGASGYRDALSNLVRVIGKHERDRPAVVILGREDTIQETRATLVDLGAAVSRWRVDFFDEDHAKEFVKQKALAYGKKPLPELDEFLGSFFEQVRAALGHDEDESRSFTGYAPVLDALALFYASEDNPLRALRSFEGQDRVERVWRFLYDVIEQICDRESLKFSRSFGADDPAKAEFGKVVYSSTLQVQFLLSDSPGNVPFEFPVDAKAEWLDSLEGQLLDQFREHPFLRPGAADEYRNPLSGYSNVAFRDFALAFALQIEDESLGSAMNYWAAPEVTPSVMFSRFAAVTAGADARHIPSICLSALLESHASGSEIAPLAFLEIREASDFTGFEIELFDSGSRIGGLLRAEAEARLEIGRGLSNATLDLPSSTIVFGLGFQDFVVGPDVRIASSVLDVQVAELRVRSRQGVPVIIETGRVQGILQRIVPPSKDVLSVAVSPAPFPWQQFAVSFANLPGEGRVIHAGLTMRRLLSWFARQSRGPGGLNYPVDAMDSVLRKGRAPREAFEFLQERRHLVEQGHSYVLELPVSGRSVMQLDFTDDALVKWLEEFAAWTSGRPR
ncbi:hypothetical protein [Cellulosimicrobium composti]|uniref:Uncharacterized protein n=1 Tax=Cellulosimicrobium composti TaxID=2672572 RepID=A0ABX0BB71_9MICO|nr:hypothetical protein [Cellulosimicrobium composti]NDO88204.1 hypothetical protein [Cellulosimicrobium composti]